VILAPKLASLSRTRREFESLAKSHSNHLPCLNRAAQSQPTSNYEPTPGRWAREDMGRRVREGERLGGSRFGAKAEAGDWDFRASAGSVRLSVWSLTARKAHERDGTCIILRLKTAACLRASPKLPPARHKEHAGYAGTGLSKTDGALCSFI
jgi:hypothetical protein